MRIVTMSDTLAEVMKSIHPMRHNAIDMNVVRAAEQTVHTETDEVSVIARGRACVRTVQNRQ